jgi:putative ABC transport system permease protein
MTQQASTSVSVDWQIQLPPGTNFKIIIVAVGQSTSYTALQQVDYADSTGFTSETNGTVQTTGPGKVLGISPNTAKTFLLSYAL